MAVYQLKTFLDLVTAVREELGVQSTDTTHITRIKRDINTVYAEIVAKKKWWWLDGTIDLTLPAYVKAGTASVTQNSNVVTLTVAPAFSKRGFFFALDGYNEVYTIDSHSGGSTTLKLHNAFTGTTQSGANYKIWTDRLALPTDCKETHEVYHDYYRKPLDNVSRGEYRRMRQLSSRNEAKPFCYFTGDYADPGLASAVASLPSLSFRSSNLMVKTLQFSSSIPTSLVTSINAGEPVRWRISAAGEPSYNGDVYISSVSTTAVANDTVSYTGLAPYTESATADTGLVVQQINQEADYNRYREMFLYPSLSSSNLVIHVDYVKEVVPLSLDSDEPLIPYQDRAVLRYGALHLMWSKMRNPEEAARNKALYEEKLAKMESKWQDGTETARLQPSKNYLAAKRNSSRKRFTDGDGSSLPFAGGSTSGQVITGTANKLAVFGTDGVLTASSTSEAQINALSSLTSGHVYVGNASNAATDTALSGDVSLANTGAVTVGSVGGSSAAAIHAAELAANAAASANTPSTIVKRDASGNFSAGTITASLTGNVTGNASGTAASITGNLTGDVTSVGMATSYSATVPLNKGGTGQTTKSAAFDALSPMSASGDIIYGGTSGTGTRLARGTDGQVLALASGAPSWTNPSSNLAVASKTTTYTATASDDLILCDSSGAAFTVTLPAATGNSGKQLRIKKTDSSVNAVTIARAGSDLIDGDTSLKLCTQNDDVLLVSDGSSNWYVLVSTVRVAVQYTGAAQSVASATDTAIVAATKVFDTHGAWDGTSTFTAPVPGFYVLFSIVFFQAPGGAIAYTTGFRVNAGATTLMDEHDMNPPGALNQNMGRIYPVKLAKGDTVTFRVTQGTGGALNMTPSIHIWKI